MMLENMLSLNLQSRCRGLVSIDFMTIFFSTKRGHDYGFVVVDQFSKMEILAPCKNNVTMKGTTKFFSKNICVHFIFPNTIVSNRHPKHILVHPLVHNGYGTHEFIAFHPQTNGSTLVFIMMIRHSLIMYNSKHR
jgi:hypothetical protein